MNCFWFLTKEVRFRVIDEKHFSIIIRMYFKKLQKDQTAHRAGAHQVPAL